MAASATDCASALSELHCAPCAWTGERRSGLRRQVQHHTPNRGTDPPQFARASQNIAAAAMLLRSLSEPNDPRERAIHRNLRALVETAAVQQAECSESRR